jgi:hypothetical protein
MNNGFDFVFGKGGFRTFFSPTVDKKLSEFGKSEAHRVNRFTDPVNKKSGDFRYLIGVVEAQVFWHHLAEYEDNHGGAQYHQENFQFGIGAESEDPF